MNRCLLSSDLIFRFDLLDYQRALIVGIPELLTVAGSGIRSVKIEGFWGDIHSSAEKAIFDDLTVTPVTPVPEPETYGMMLMGFGLIGFVARRRKNQQA